MSREATSEHSLVREGASYDEVFGSSHEPENFSWSSKRETSAQSTNKEVGSYGEEGEEEIVSEEEKERDSDGDGDEGDKEPYEGTSGSPGGNHPFILLEDWTVNKFLPKMSDRVFKELRSRYQIPYHIPIRLPRKDERCYSGRTVNVSMYDAMSTTGLRLPLTTLHRQLADFLGLSVSQFAPNTWRIFIGAEIV